MGFHVTGETGAASAVELSMSVHTFEQNMLNFDFHRFILSA